MSIRVVVACLIMLTFCVSCSKGGYKKHVALFVFGDSLFDPGNNNYINTTTNYMANFRPYGESYFSSPTGRFSDGRLIPDFIAEFAKLPFIPAYLDPTRQSNDFVFGANFASGGAGALAETNAGFVVSLKTQLEYFSDLENQFRRNLGNAKTEQLLSDAVYLFSCGINDHSNIKHPYTHEDYTEMIIGNLTNVFKGIHEKGGRKFAMVNLPPACLPTTRARQKDHRCDEKLDIIPSLHNTQLSKKLQELGNHLEGFMYSLFDLYTAFRDRMNNPSHYGFKDGMGACCGSGPFRGISTCGGTRGESQFGLCDNVSDYLFFDSAHPSEKASHQYAKLFWKGDTNITKPRNLRTLFKGKHK